LNNFETLKACTTYMLAGVETTELPFDLSRKDLVPVYKTYPGWKCSLEGIDQPDQLPSAVQSYMDALVEYLNVPISMISTGPDRKELIVINA
jgi:adenylosuccinate synthase